MPTDRGNAKVSAARDAGINTCSVLLPEQIFEKLGQDPSCEWLTDNQLRVFFGRGVSLLPSALSTDGDVMQMARDAVYNKAGNSFASVNIADIRAPDDAEAEVRPRAVLSSATEVGVCSDLELDATASTGGAGRELSLSFSASARDGLSVDVTNALRDAVLQAPIPGKITIPSRAMGSGRLYDFRMAAANFLGIRDVASVTVRKSDIPLPTVSIAGSSTRVIPRGAGTTVTARASAPDISCLPITDQPAGAEGRIVFTWELVDGPDILEGEFPSEEQGLLFNNSLATRYLYIPPNTLRSGVNPDGSPLTYVFSVTASMADNDVLSSVATVELMVQPEPIRARIQGGDQIIPPGTDLFLDVVAVDPEDSPGAFSYIWTCTDQASGENCFGTLDSAASSRLGTAGDNLHLDGGMLEPGVYTFTATVSREPVGPGRQVSSFVQVTVQGGTAAMSAGTGGASSLSGGLVLVVPLPTGATDDGGSGAAPPPATPEDEGEEEEEEEEPEPAWSVSISAPAAQEVPASELLILQGLLEPPPGAVGTDATYLWSCVEGDLSIPNALARVAENSLQDSYLALPPGTLTSGQQYRFRLEAGGAAQGASAEISILAATAPWAGSLEARSPLGVTETGRPRALELTTELELSARDWTAAAVYDFYYVPDVERILEAAGEDPAAWRQSLDREDVVAQLRYLGRAPEGSVSLTAILPEGTHLVAAYITSPSGAVTRAPFPELFEVEPPPRLRRALQQRDAVTQAEASVTLALEPAVLQGDLTRAMQFVTIYADRYPGTAPIVPLSGCSLGSMERVTRTVTDAALEIQATLPPFLPRTTQDVCDLASLVQDPTQASGAMVQDALERVMDALDGGYLTPRGMQCAAALMSHALSNAESTCGSSGSDQRRQDDMDSVREAISVLAAAASASLRPGMRPVVFDTAQMAIEVSAHLETRAVGDVASVLSSSGGSASYDVVFADPPQMLAGPSLTAGVMELRSSLVVFNYINPLPQQSEYDRLASLPASLELRAVEVNPSNARHLRSRLDPAGGSPRDHPGPPCPGPRNQVH